MNDHPASETFQHAELDWDENGLPQSRQYGDVYFSRASGLAETEHVFLAQNELAQRFAALQSNQHLVIGETGFGTGLNFLCAWQLFERTADAQAHLHFVSVEKHPLSHDDMQRALALWPELQTQAGQLLQQYVALNPGFQRFVFAGGRVVLTLLIGDVLDCLPSLDARVRRLVSRRLRTGQESADVAAGAVRRTGQVVRTRRHPSVRSPAPVSFAAA